MKKIILLTAVLLGFMTEAAAVIYTIRLRGQVVYGGEYLILPLFILLSYLVMEMMDSIKIARFNGKRMTRRTKYGTAVLKSEAFPKYAEECLIREMSAFEPFKDAVERLCEYEEADHVQK